MTDRKKMGLKYPSNEDEFREMMLKVDSHLQTKDLKPFQRPLNAWHTIATEFDMQMPLFGSGKKIPSPGSYAEEDLTLRINQWYEETYEEALNMPSLGTFFILIRNDPWILDVCQTFGTVNFFISKTISSSDQTTDLKLRRAPKVNIFDLIRAFPPGYKNILENNDLNKITEQFNIGFPAVLNTAQCASLDYVKEALSDIDASVNHACSRIPHYGQSKWSSMMALEKMFKAFIKTKGGQVKTSHDPYTHAKASESFGLPTVDRNLIKSIKCSAGIRYGEEGCTLLDAHSAHISALKIILSISGHLMK